MRPPLFAVINMGEAHIIEPSCPHELAEFLMSVDAPHKFRDANYIEAVAVVLLVQRFVTCQRVVMTCVCRSWQASSIDNDIDLIGAQYTDLSTGGSFDFAC